MATKKPEPVQVPTKPYTNTGACLLHIAGLHVKPGDTVDIPEDLVDQVEESPVYRAGLLKRGKVDMPPPALIALPDVLPDDLVKALASIRVQDNPTSLTRWTEAESSGPKRPEILEALRTRARELTK